MDIEDGDHDEHLKEENREEEPYEGRGEVVQQGHHSALLDYVIKWQDLSGDTQLIEPTWTRVAVGALKVTTLLYAGNQASITVV